MVILKSCLVYPDLVIVATGRSSIPTRGNIPMPVVHQGLVARQQIFPSLSIRGCLSNYSPLSPPLFLPPFSLLPLYPPPWQANSFPWKMPINHKGFNFITLLWYVNSTLCKIFFARCWSAPEKKCNVRGPTACCDASCGSLGLLEFSPLLSIDGCGGD